VGAPLEAPELAASAEPCRRAPCVGLKRFAMI